MPLSTMESLPQACVLDSTLQENADSSLPGKTAPESIFQRLSHPSLFRLLVPVKLACFPPLPSPPSSPVTVLHFAPIVHPPLDLRCSFPQAFSTWKAAHLHGVPRCARWWHACGRLDRASLPSQGVLTQSLEPVTMSPYIRWELGRMETGVHPLAAF